MSRKDFIAGYRAAMRNMRQAELSNDEIYDEAERLVRDYGQRLRSEFEKIEQDAKFKEERAVAEFEANIREVVRGGLEQAGDDFNRSGFEDYVIDLAEGHRPAGWTLNL